MPLFRSFDLAVIESVFVKRGIHVLERFGDGQIRFGNQPLPEKGKQFKGKSFMASRYEPYSTNTGKDFYDIFTIRAIIGKLGYGDDTEAIEAEIEGADLLASEKD